MYVYENIRFRRGSPYYFKKLKKVRLYKKDFTNLYKVSQANDNNKNITASGKTRTRNNHFSQGPLIFSLEYRSCKPIAICHESSDLLTVSVVSTMI